MELKKKKKNEIMNLSNFFFRRVLGFRTRSKKKIMKSIFSEIKLTKIVDCDL